jgi:RNA polymerase sigma-70 factor (ECF subfamily)
MGNPSPDALDERDLARRAARGEEAAFTEIVRRHQGAVYRLCLRYLSSADAEDAAQEAFVKAFTHRERLDPERPVLPWLLTVARNLSIDRVRRHRSSPTEAAVEDADAHADPRAASAETAALSSERATLLERGLAELPEGQREAVVLFHVEGLPYKDIATALDVPVGTVMTWLHRARGRLRKALEPTEESRS